MKKVSPASKLKRTCSSRGGTIRTMKTVQQFVTAMVFFATVLAVLLPSPWQNNSNVVVANAKEIQATKEWTLLGENDTIDAGMHVRMDLSTGEKWVKLPDENETDEKQAAAAAATSAASVGMTGESSSSSSSAGSYSSSGVAVVPETLSSADEKQQQDEPQQAAAVEPDYDYEMMHRTLSQLPPDEQERMGGLPKLPEANDHSTGNTASTTTITSKEREMFEARMKEIWLRRQEELRQVQEEHVVDLPRLLKFRIQAIREYLDNPIQVLEQMELLKEESSDGDDDDADENGDDDDVTMIPATNLVALLQDLEFHLNDLDMTRDFYTLGGWPLLASLVSKNVHYISNSTTANNGDLSSSTDNATTTTTKTTTKAASEVSIDDKVLAIRAHAAWTLGTAVKNIGEFRAWVLEPIAALIVEDATDTTMTASTTTTTPLNLVVQGFMEASSSSISTSDATTTSDSSSSTLKYQQQLAQKTVYALGSFLRGNPLAQVAFSTMSTVTDDGDKKTNLAQLLGERVAQWVKESATTSSSKSTMQQHTMKMTTRLLSLADDVVNDVQLHADDASRRALTTAEQDAKVIDAFSSRDWCLAAHHAATVEGPLQDAALRAVGTIGPHCSSSYNSKHVVDMAMLMKRTHDAANGDDDDDDKERLQLVEKALAAIGTTPKAAATKK